jgi:ribonuclease HI
VTQMAKLFDDPSSEESRVECWFDGAIAPVNPGGHASYGVVIKLDGEVVLSEGGYVGHGPTMSNNVAEAAGAIRVLEALPTLLDALPDGATAVVYGDSQVVINQIAPAEKEATTRIVCSLRAESTGAIRTTQATCPFPVDPARAQCRMR